MSCYIAAMVANESVSSAYIGDEYIADWRQFRYTTL